MKFYKNLYLSDTIKRPGLVKIKLRLHKIVPGIFIIRIAENDSDQLEIISSIYMKQKWFWKQKNEIVGLAGSNNEAIEIVMNITQEVVDKTGAAQIKDYLIQQSKNIEV